MEINKSTIFRRIHICKGFPVIRHSLSAGTAYSANLTVAWDANSEPDLIGYRVYCGESSGNYTVSQDITSSNPSNPPPTTCEFTDLEEGKKYYFAASADDAEENSAGRVSTRSSDLELTYDRSYQTVGMRFGGTAIPVGATIVNAYIQFQTDETQSVATSLTIQGEDADNAGSFLRLTGNISSRPRTAAAVSWSPPAWTTAGEAGPDQRTPNIASVIQEIVNRPGWSSENAMVLIITGTGERVAESYDGNSAAAPLLHVEFTPGG
jgi:hypothetical protein